MKSIILERAYFPFGTFGEMLVQRAFGPVHLCVTVERPSSGPSPCIPEGTYTCKLYDSPTHGPVFQVMNVPGRTFIEIHTANLPSELLGCIAPNMKFGYREPGHIPGGMESKIAYAKFLEYLDGDKEFRLDMAKMDKSYKDFDSLVQAYQ